MRFLFLITVLFLALPSISHAYSYSDDFNTLDASIWSSESGAWDVIDGHLHGYWSESYAYSDHANLIFTPLAKGADFDARILIDAPYRFSMRFSLVNGYNQKYNVGPKLLEVRTQSTGNPYDILFLNPNLVISDQDNTIEYRLLKEGSSYSFFANDDLLYYFVDTIFNGNSYLGLTAYGNDYADSFSITSPPVTTPEPASMFIIGFGMLGMICLRRRFDN